MSTEAKTISMALQESLRNYLERFPDAADSPEGIRQWWLSENLKKMSIEKLREALEILVASGEMQLSTLPDGTELYAKSLPFKND
jgi:hypothetical protein